MSKILVIDHGLALEVAITLAHANHEVGYYRPAMEDPFPSFAQQKIGCGFKEIEKVEDATFAPWLRRANVVVCPDTNSRFWCDLAAAAGKPVWGAKTGERLENDRDFCKQHLATVGLEVGDYKTFTGVDALLAFLKDHRDYWVKLPGRYRGAIETFHHGDWITTSSQFVSKLYGQIGPYHAKIPFIAEAPLKGTEIGFDGFVIDGVYPKPCLIGYEDKDCGYIGKVVDKLPAPLEAVNQALAPYFAQRCVRSIFSTEVRLAPDGKFYLTDPCVRAPHPPLAVELEAYANFAEIIVKGASGDAVTPVTHDRYWAAVEIYSDESEKSWVALEFPETLRRNIKLQCACREGGHYWAVPESFVVATCVASGDTIAAACDAVKKIVDQVHCRGMRYDLACLDRLRDDTIPNGRKAGIPF